MNQNETDIMNAAFGIIERHLSNTGRLEVPTKGVFELLPRRKGKTFCGFRNKEGSPVFSKRMRFTINSELRKTLCK
jgi:hypothetical protein